MMIRLRPGDARGQVRTGWLDSRHTFSFGHYYDPEWMGFGPLRVINQDLVAPGAGFPTHGHANMEIISIVLQGALEHRDSIGGGGVIRPGDVQVMSAGHGIEHSEFNASATEPVGFLQIWIQPDRVNAVPRYQQHAFEPGHDAGRLALLVGPDGAQAPLTIRQDARLLGATLAAGEAVEHRIGAGRRAWVQLVSGAATVAGEPLAAGDALGLESEAVVAIRALEGGARLLVFDLP